MEALPGGRASVESYKPSDQYLGEGMDCTTGLNLVDEPKQMPPSVVQLQSSCMAADGAEPEPLAAL